MRLVEVIRTNEERSLSNFRKYFSETQAKLAWLAGAPRISVLTSCPIKTRP